MSEKLFVLRDGSTLGRALIAPGHHFYLRKISRSGRTANFTADPNKAMRLTRDEWAKFRAKHPRQRKGRLVLAPLNT